MGVGMTVSKRVRGWLVDSPTSLGGRARARRWQQTLDHFPDIESLHVVDLGGTVETWLRAPLRPRHVTVLNLTEPGETDEPWITPITGDACDAVTALRGAGAATSFDLVYSNAVIEHVGGHASRARFGESVRDLAPRHWVQTPYRYFPVEPHWLFPGMQFLPVATRARIAQSWPLAHSRARTADEARSAVQWTELIGITELRSYFPDSEVLHEKVAGLTKSIVAVRQ